jgi:hypothetical protein
MVSIEQQVSIYMYMDFKESAMYDVETCVYVSLVPHSLFIVNQCICVVLLLEYIYLIVVMILVSNIHLYNYIYPEKDTPHS